MCQTPVKWRPNTLYTTFLYINKDLSSLGIDIIWSIFTCTCKLSVLKKTTRGAKVVLPLSAWTHTLLSLTCMGWYSGRSVCVCVFARVIIGMNQVRAVAHFIQATTSATSEHRWWGCLGSAMLKTHIHVHACMHGLARAGHPLWEALTSAVTLTGRWRSSKCLITLANYMISRIDRRDVQPSQAMGARRGWWRIRAGLPLQAACVLIITNRYCSPTAEQISASSPCGKHL